MDDGQRCMLKNRTCFMASFVHRCLRGEVYFIFGDFHNSFRHFERTVNKTVLITKIGHDHF